MSALLFAPPPGKGPVVLGARSVLFLVLGLWSLVLVFGGLQAEASGRGFMHLVNLPFHEAGHLLFSPFGAFLHSLGGTLGQLLMPLVCAGVLLLKTRDTFGAAVGLWWFGENFVDIAPYINDARAGVMPLLGGNTGQSSPYGFHDWNYLLTESGLLRQDHLLAWCAQVTGVLVMLVALVWAAWLLLTSLRDLRAKRLA